MKWIYETTTCGRCGGGGHYSRCAMYGTTCFGCSGSGKKFTARGLKARAAIEAYRLENHAVAAADLKPGDVIKFDRKFRTVASVNVSTCRSWSTVDGVKTEHPAGWTIEFKNNNTSYGVTHDATYAASPNDDQAEALKTFVLSFDGKGVIPNGDYTKTNEAEAKREAARAKREAKKAAKHEAWLNEADANGETNAQRIAREIDEAEAADVAAEAKELKRGEATAWLSDVLADGNGGFRDGVAKDLRQGRNAGGFSAKALSIMSDIYSKAHGRTGSKKYDEAAQEFTTRFVNG